jgi:hypothetical protein
VAQYFSNSGQRTASGEKCADRAQYSHQGCGEIVNEWACKDRSTSGVAFAMRDLLMGKRERTLDHRGSPQPVT